MTVNPISPAAHRLAGRLRTTAGVITRDVAQRIIDNPQAHVDALVEAGVLRRYTSGAYGVIPPTCPTCGQQR